MYGRVLLDDNNYWWQCPTRRSMHPSCFSSLGVLRDTGESYSNYNKTVSLSQSNSEKQMEKASGLTMDTP